MLARAFPPVAILSPLVCRLLFEARDANQLWLLKGAPRRFYKPNVAAIVVENAPTRYGTVGLHLNISSSPHRTDRPSGGDGSSSISSSTSNGRGSGGGAITAAAAAAAGKGKGAVLNFSAQISWTLHGRGYVQRQEGGGSTSSTAAATTGSSSLTVVLRLRDFSNGAQAAFSSVSVEGACKPSLQAPAAETVSVLLIAAAPGSATRGECTLVASLID